MEAKEKEIKATKSKTNLVEKVIKNEELVTKATKILLPSF